MRRAIVGGLALLGLLAMPGLGAGAQAGERLQVPELPGWKVVVNVADRAGESTELIPAAETADGWTRRVTVQAFRGSPMTVPDFLDQVVQRTAEVCDGATAGPSGLGKVSGLEAGTRSIACGRYKGDGRGSFTLHYVVRGREAFYVITRLWRGVPFNPSTTPISQEELAEWTDYVNSVEVCDTTDPARRCRQ
ncbi:MAG TPA: hypothetical protein VL974_02930 [Magnetospirillum sp.]|jgi:hypothetical protein|nr:hypothetical protein [Magnetospirillum sp.]